MPDFVIRNLGERGVIEPFDCGRVQPASYDVALDHRFKMPDPSGSLSPIDPLDAAATDDMVPMDVGASGVFVLPAKGFALGSTVERFEIPDNVVARIEGRSSLARLGLAIHITAGFVDPGFPGQLTLELFNFRSRPFRLTAGMIVGQVSFERMLFPAKRPYGSPGLGSKYVDQDGPVESRGVTR